MSFDLLRDPISASRETIQFRFKTSHANGVLMYSKGTQGDFFALQLYENRMILNINLGEMMIFALLSVNFIFPSIFRLNGNEFIFRGKSAR